MANAPQHDPSHDDADPVESIVGVIHWVIPLAGAFLIFLLAFIAVVMA